MARKVKVGLIQMASKAPAEASCEEHRKAMLDAHVKYIEEAGKKGVNVAGYRAPLR